MIRAAGCVLWRHRSGGDGIEIALVHRAKYDDWSHPKGKLEPGEEPLAAALREVREETGMACEAGAPLPTTRYRVTGGRDRDSLKEVRYWSARATSGGFEPSHEVDRLEWLPPAAARRRLSYTHDRALVDALLDAHPAALMDDRRAAPPPPTGR